ncbi:MAG: flagellar basal-body rod protein FlgG [Anaerolineae bacterium]|nr:flagellar basal-body rod protein FlgG [Anaerolineae bacterium]
MPSISLTSLLHIARSGLLSQQIGIDTVANNIANLNTTGYKYNRAEFHELLNAQLQAPPAGSNRPAGQADGTLLAATQRIFSQGEIQTSDQPWDMAIEGDGFFPIQQPDGSVAYTRDGSFRLDGEGRLTTADGFLLLPVITLPPDMEEAMVNSNGEIMVRRKSQTEPQAIATINLARFANFAGLNKIGDNLYQPTDVSGPAQAGQPGQNGLGKIISHALEGSNVDLSQQMVDLISAQRAYTLMVRAMETSNEMLGLVNQMRS